MAEPTTITCLNGSFTAASRAAVPLTDRGFRFGDGVFETVRIENGAPYQWPLHFQRLLGGLAAIGILAPEIEWEPLLRRTIARNQARDGFLRIAVSRGTGSRGYLPHPPAMPVTYAIEYIPAIAPPAAPYRLWLSEWAKIPANCLPAKFKLAQGLNSTLALQEATGHGCDEALQLNTNGMLSETASANLFWLKNGTLFTPSLDCHCLAGTTRDALLRLSPLPTRMVQSGIQALETADAVFITNTRLGIHPVASIQPLGWEYRPHPIIPELQRLLDADRKRDSKSWGKR